MKIGLAQINPTIGALHANSAKIIDFAKQARRQGAELVIFPELAICGYPPLDLVEKTDFVRASREALVAASRAVDEVTLLCGCVTPARAETGKSVHNSAVVLAGGEVIFEQSKMLLPTYDVFDEWRNFAPARAQRVWAWNGRRVALTICEDAWNDKTFWPRRQARLLYERDPVVEQMSGGADCLINISASPFAVGKMCLRQEMLAAIATEHRVPVIMVNQVGGNDQLVFDGSSVVIGADGRLLARARAFVEDLVIVDTGDWRGVTHPGPADETQAMFDALVLGTRDYVRKCGFDRAIVGLSGGIDSALTATIAVAALGHEQVLGIGMPSRYSSEGSVADARRLAENLGIKFKIVPIEAPFKAFSETLAGQWGRECEAAADLTEQNLQSRIRGTILMAFSNRTGALVLSTGNKSELATGYCTLYGDMAGGLAVISDVLKTQVYELARYVNREREVIPRASIEKAPSAELKPDQRDLDDLPPYEIVDAVVRDYVEEYKTAEQIVEAHGLPEEIVKRLIWRIDHSEYKRQQAAPGLKISKKAFGMGRRFPIAQQYGSRN